MISLARDIFEDAREASFELYRHDLKYNAMEARALSLGGQTDAHVASGGIADRMRPVDAMVDYEALMERKAARWCEMVDRAVRVLYGDDWEHGIAASLSMSHAEVLDCIYTQRMSLTATAKRVKWGVNKVCELRREAFDHIDQVGELAAIAGK